MQLTEVAGSDSGSLIFFCDIRWWPRGLPAQHRYDSNRLRSSDDGGTEVIFNRGFLRGAPLAVQHREGDVREAFHERVGKTKEVNREITRKSAKFEAAGKSGNQCLLCLWISRVSRLRILRIRVRLRPGSLIPREIDDAARPA